MLRSALVAVVLVACNGEGETKTITNNQTITLTDTVFTPTTITNTNTVTNTNTNTITNTVTVPPEEPPPFPDVLAPVFIHQPIGLFGAYSHLLDLDLDSQGRVAVASFYPALVDATDPANVVDVGYFADPDTTNGRYHFVTTEGSDILVDGIKSALRRFAVQADGSMLEEATWASSTDRIQYGNDLENDRAYVALAQDGVSIRDRATLQTELGVIPAPNALDVTVVGDTAFVLDRELGLSTWDVTDAASPVQLGALFLEGGYNSMILEGDLAVVSAASHVHLVDVLDPASPALLSSIESDSGVALRADVEGDALIVAEYNDWRVWDIADRTAPVFVGQEDAYDAALSVRIDGTRVYLGDWDLLKAYDLDLTARAPEIHYDWPVYLIAPAGSPAAIAVPITNAGNEPLEVTDIACPVQGVSVSPAAFTLQPGESTVVTVDVDFVMPTGDEHNCTIVSNDPDEPYAALTVEVNRDGLGVGEAAPELSLPDLDGVQRDLASYEGTDTDADGIVDTGGYIVYIHLFSSNCQQCVSSMAAVEQEIDDVFGSDPDFFSVALSSSVVGIEDPVYLADFTATYGLEPEQVWVDWAQPAVIYNQWTITSDEAFAPYPRHFVIGRDGIVKYASYEAELTGAVEVIAAELASF